MNDRRTSVSLTHQTLSYEPYYVYNHSDLCLRYSTRLQDYKFGDMSRDQTGKNRLHAGLKETVGSHDDAVHCRAPGPWKKLAHDRQLIGVWSIAFSVDRLWPSRTVPSEKYAQTTITSKPITNLNKRQSTISIRTFVILEPSSRLQVRNFGGGECATFCRWQRRADCFKSAAPC